MKQTIHKQKENLLYLALWLLLFIIPLMTGYIRSINSPIEGMQWHEVFEIWKTLAIFLTAFVIHNFFVAPLLVYRNKKTAYFAMVASLMLVFILIQCQRPGPKRLPMHGPIAISKTVAPPPQAATPEHKPGHKPEYKPGHKPAYKPGHQPGQSPQPPIGKTGKRPVDIGFNDIVGVILLLSLLGLNLGVKYYFKNDEDAKVLAKLKEQNLEQQLEYLKYQINPHFLMNTLNNIHALVDIDPERAKELIVIMSRLMRHMLYEGSKSLIPLQREVDFLQNYIELMRIRYTDQVDITVEMPSNIPETNIPPLLFITFVENAFKHGVSYRQRSFIRLKLTVDNNQLCFLCANSKRQDTGQHQTEQLQGGMGLSNIQQRLKLLYGNDYHLELNDGSDTYEVKLILPTPSLPK